MDASAAAVAAPAPRAEATPIAPRDVFRDRHGFLTDGVYRVSNAANADHTYTTRREGASYFNDGEDVERLSLEVAQAADRDDLWIADHGSSHRRRAKVRYGRDVGIHGRSGQPTSIINVYRKRSGTVHISPGSPE